MNALRVLARCGAFLSIMYAIAGCGVPVPPTSETAPPSTASNAASVQTPPTRIVSLAPNVTETLFALGVGEKVVGVTQFCDYPPEVEGLKRVGGFVDPNYEEIVALKPDLTILLTSHRHAERELAKMNIRTLVTPHETFEDVQESIRLIGDACGVPDKASALLKDIAERTEAVRRATQGRPRPSVLICLGRDLESGQMAGLYVAGRGNLYDEVIETAGGVNACTEGMVAYPQLSAEGVVELNPDVIIDLVSMIEPQGRTVEEISRDWEPLRTVNAVSNGRVHVIVGNHALRPGPRTIQFLEEVARLLHPAAFETNAASSEEKPAHE